MSLEQHAERELRMAGLFDRDSDYEGETGKAALELVKVFAAQGHSGFSAGMATEICQKLMRYETLTPLTGKHEEWNNITETNGGNVLFQNNRCSHVFKDSNGAYDIDGIIWKDWGRSGRFTSGASRVRVKFPYMPKRVYKTCYPWVRALWWLKRKLGVEL